ncbi:PA-phosphatase [Anopheles sinensis]|uniref:PA-phosphatase n=1 Tax=Anopheles sinensis TaxID=74873 RepID=A0A084VWE6_ANOSI|nr:PA-phosphatase [Anopheles sinensis]
MSASRKLERNRFHGPSLECCHNVLDDSAFPGPSTSIRLRLLPATSARSVEMKHMNVEVLGRSVGWKIPVRQCVFAVLSRWCPNFVRRENRDATLICVV